MQLRRLVGVRTLVVVLSFVALEAGLGLFTSFGRWTVTERDPHLGWRMIPNQVATWNDENFERRINSTGFRDREWEAPRLSADAPAGTRELARAIAAGDTGVALPPGDESPWEKDGGVFRVALVGNSMTYGAGVPLEDTFGRVLEAQLSDEFERRGDSRRVLVMNFAVLGYVFEQMARTYEHSIRPFRPDLLVVATLSHDILPFEGGETELDFPYRRRIALTATHDLLLKRVMLPLKARLELRFEPHRAAAAHRKLDDAISARPFAPEHEPYWDATRARLADIRSQVVADGGRLVVLSLPQFSIIARPKARGVGEVWNEWAAEQGSATVLAVDPRQAFESAMPELLAAVRERGYKNATVENLATGFTELAPDLPALDESLYLAHDLGHYAEKGHAVVGHALFRALRDAGWLTARPGG